LPSGIKNVLDGLNKRDYTGTVYVVSVSGGKMYNLNPNGWDAFEEADQDRAAENTQLFQVISVDGSTLSYESYTATGQLYDAFDLEKSANGQPNRFVERKDEAIPERRHDNTIPYYDSLPEALEARILSEHPGFQIERVRYFEREEQKGFSVRMFKEAVRLDLVIDMEGNTLQQNLTE